MTRMSTCFWSQIFECQWNALLRLFELAIEAWKIRMICINFSSKSNLFALQKSNHFKCANKHKSELFGLQAKQKKTVSTFHFSSSFVLIFVAMCRKTKNGFISILASFETARSAHWIRLRLLQITFHWKYFRHETSRLIGTRNTSPSTSSRRECPIKSIRLFSWLLFRYIDYSFSFEPLNLLFLWSSINKSSTVWKWMLA